MSIFSSTRVIVACGDSGQAIGTATHRVFPSRLDVCDNTGAPADNERAGRVLQRLDEGFLDVPAERSDELRRWLNANAIELVYRFTCPEHGAEWALSPDLARAIRHNRGASSWVKIPTH